MKTQHLLLPFALLGMPTAAIPAASCWGYSGESAPENWSKLDPAFAACEKGVYQSPINIRNAIKGKLPPLSLSFTAKKNALVHNGHTLQINVADGDKLRLDNQDFTLQQCHFHMPSENLIDGKSYPLEAHFVYRNDQDQLAVVGVMFVKGEANTAIAYLLRNLPRQINVAVPLTAAFSLASLLPKNKSYYRFSGSLTTPPCTEGVRWLILRQPVELSAAQINAFSAALGIRNNRPVHPLHGRMVVTE